MKQTLKKFALLRVAHSAIRALREQFGFNLRWIYGLVCLVRFAREYRNYRRLAASNPNFSLQGGDILPCLLDRTETTPIEPVYFLQDTWCARKIAERRPRRHVDIGSSAKSMALIAQFIPVTFVDIRRVELEVSGFSFQLGSVVNLPFADASVESLSCVCVLEHIGLGRYGDPVDAQGSEKAAVELARVLAPGGDLYITVPVDQICRIYFNAHRAFTRDYLLSMFPNLHLAEERYIYGVKIYPQYSGDLGFGTGLFHIRKL